jgi:hypothetical protein
LSTLLWATALSIVPAVAAAEPPTSDKVSAQALFDEAKALAVDQKWAEACPKLEESQRLDPHMVTLYRLADCYEKIGRTASASVLFREAASLARDAGSRAREKAALERVAALDSTLARMVIVVPEVPGIQVARDDVVIGRQQWGIKVSVDPGSHSIVATAPGRKPFRSVVTVAGAGSVTVTVPALEPEEVDSVVLGSEPVQSPAPAPMLLPGPVPGNSSHALGLVGGVTFGIGAAVTTTGIILLATTDSSQSTSCPFTRCGLPGVLFWAGTIATVSGAVMWLASRASQPSSAVYVSFGARAVGVGATF